MALLPQSVGFSLEGNPTLAYNGVYRKVSEHKGWPVLQNGADKFCYHHELTDRWFLWNDHTPDSATCNSNILSVEARCRSVARPGRSMSMASLLISG